MEETMKDYKWLTKDGALIKMVDMDAKHLQYAYTHACVKEYEYHLKSGGFSDLREQLEAVAESRNIKLAQPDETHPSPKWANYFCARRKTEKVVLSKVQPSISSYKGLKEVDA